jgi:hypothetical protein
VVFGPEGCGKTAWLKQAAETLRELGFEAIYIDPMRKEFVAHTDAGELIDKLAEAAAEAISRIVKKVSEGKRLSDREVMVLVMSLMMRRFDDFREHMDKSIDDLKAYVNGRIDDMKAYVDKRIDDLKTYVDGRFEGFKAYVDGRFNAIDKRMDAVERKVESLEKRIDAVHNEVSSIKTDIVKMMKELLERVYGEKKS